MKQINRKAFVVVITICVTLCSCHSEKAKETSTPFSSSAVDQTATSVSITLASVEGVRTSDTKDITSTAIQTTSVATSIIPPNEYEYTDEDRELRQLLSEKADMALLLFDLYNDGFAANPNEADAVFAITKQYDDREIEYFLQSSELPFTTVDELENAINECFCDVGARELIDTLCRGVTVTNGTETTYAAPVIADYNGRIYRTDCTSIGYPGFDCATARVKSKTDKEIVFSYFSLEPFIEEEKWSEFKGVLKYDDGWKYAWNIKHPELLASDMEIPAP